MNEGVNLQSTFFEYEMATNILIIKAQHVLLDVMDDTVIVVKMIDSY